MLCVSLQAQTNTSNSALSFPSSNNSFLGKLIKDMNVGVDHYSGTAIVNVPICDLSSKEMSLPVALNYVDGRGVRTQEYASQVGLGWQLSAGGSISRVVRGFPDEQSNGYLGTGQWGQKVYQGCTGSGGYVNFFTTLYAISPSYDYMLSGQTEPNGTPVADGEPDIFSVRTPFFNFEFVFDKDGNPVFPNYTGYKVVPSNFVNTSAYGSSSFEVVDDKGDQFFFGNNANAIEQSQDTIYGQWSSPFTTSWYLTKIVSYNSKDVINFTYQAAPSSDIQYQYSWMETQDTYYSPAHTQTSMTSGKTIIFAPKFVSTISSSLGELDFSYSFTRTDDPSVPYLASITKKAWNPATGSNSTTLQTYNFNYGYFNQGFANVNYLRLQLNSVSVTGNTAATSSPLTIASFGYNTGVQDRTSPVFDYFGYPTNPGPIPADIFNINRTPVLSFAQGGVLNTIKTMLGGTWNITYELNTFNPGAGSTTIGGLRVNNISQTLPTGETLSKSFQYLDPNGYSSGNIYSPLYNSLSVTTITTNGLPYNVFFSSSPYTVNDVNGIFVGYSYVKEVDQKGGYTLYNFTNFSDFNDTYLATGNALGFLHTPTTSLAYKRGLLKNRQIHDANNNLLSDVKYNYTSLSTVSNAGYGMRVVILPAKITSWYTYGFYSTTVENYLLSSVVETDYQQYNTANTNITSNIPKTTTYTYDVNTSNKSALIQTVTTSDSKAQSVSKRFYYPADAGIPALSGAPEQAALAGMSAANRINMPVHETDTRNGATTEVHNIYLVGNGANNLNNTSNTYLANTINYNTLSGTRAQGRQQAFNYDQANYNVLSSSGYSGFSSATPGGKSTAVAYGYNVAYPVAKIENASSTNSVSTSAITATGRCNFNSSTSFTTVSTGTIPISIAFMNAPAGGSTTTATYTLSGPSGSVGNLCVSLGGTTCSYPSGVTLTNMPAGNYTLTVNGSTTYPAANPYIYFSYPSSTTTVTYTNEYFFESFEENSSATSGAAHTGRRYYGSNYTVTFAPPNARAYMIQYWNLVSGAWVFNEQAYSQNMVLTGPVDDVRVFPKDALMTTLTYDPLVGKTSETDPAGKSTIYQYDGLNRLQTILDQDKNVVKQYDYEYQQLPVPVTNMVQYRSFQRSCPVGQVGSYVLYTVPAGTYSSYISQADADGKAANDINANGQAYANNPANGGTCVTAYNINYNDSRAFQYSVRFTNNSTGVIYNFTPNANSSGTLGAVPAGTYTVFICPINNYTPNNNYTVGGSSQTNVVCATFSNVVVSAAINVYFF